MDMNGLQTREYLELELKSVLGLDENFLLDADKEFSLYGMNSIVSARFCHALSQKLQQEIAPKVVVDNDTISKLAAYLTDELKIAGVAGSATPASAATGTVVQEAAAATAHGRAQNDDNDDPARKDALVGKIIHALKRKLGASSAVDFSFIFFSSSSSKPVDNKYDYVVNIARYADANGFKAVWVPERHFFEFGGVFPDPALLLANIAAVTRELRLRSGSVVLPLHHSTNVVESWSMLDNLSGGRVDMAFASGWNPNDFVSSPHTYPTLRQTWFERMAEVERLWRGEAIEYYNGKQELVPIKVYPRPIQGQLNIWMAISGNEQSFIEAGKRGYNILTMLMSKPVEELAANIQRYRRARAEAGFDPEAGIVSLMLHTFVHDDREKVERCVNEHYFNYIKSGLKGHIQAMPKAPSEAEINNIVEHSFHYQRKNSALFGDVDHCLSVVQRLRAVGVNEIACLVDFGISETEMYETLPFISQLRDRANGRSVNESHSSDTSAPAPVSAPVSAPAVARASKAGGGRVRDEYAIVGLAGRYPAARSVEEFWRNLLNQRNCLSEITDERYDWRAVYGDPKLEPAKTNIKNFGLIDDIYEFDAAFFRISNREGELMDPHARLLLETVWQAVENSGVHPGALNQSKTGVFLSFYNNEYSHLLNEATVEKSSEPYVGTALSGTVKANRISFLMGLTGPSEVYDTACSSSLVALHRAMQAMSAGDCDQALVAGVSLLLSPARVVALSKMGILNEGGICNPYSYPANKEVIGEGVGALLIKPLSTAVAEGDPIYAVVCGSDVSHQGNSSGHLTMPSAKSLAELIATTYRKLDLDCTQISYFEGHGSGNDSDVVELMALQQCFKDRPADRPISLGSVKSNVGFGEASGGMAQLTKCALSVHYGVVPATLNFTKCDPTFDLSAAHIEVLTDHKVLAADSDHHVSVLAYGLGGTNAHVVLRNHRQAASRATAGSDRAPCGENEPYPMIFSAGSAAALRQYLQATCAHLADPQVRAQLERRFSTVPGDLLPSLARTLMERERHATQRVAFVVPTYEALLQAIGEYLSGGLEDRMSNASMVILPSQGTNKGQMREFLDICLEQKRVDKLAMLWVNGVDFDWRLFTGNTRYQRIALPPAPFSGKELRIVNRTANRAVAGDATAPEGASRLKWSRTARGVEVHVDIHADDYFIRDHVVDGKPVLPGAAYLAILNQVAREVFKAQTFAVRNIAWLMPFELAGAASSSMQLTFDEQGQFRVMDQARQILCCKGHLEVASAAPAGNFQPRLSNANPPESARLLDGAEYWSLVNSAEAKQAHGESMRQLVALYRQEVACVALLKAPSAGRSFPEIPVLDGALGAIVGLALMDHEQLAASVPFSIDAFHWLAPISSSAGDPAPLYAVVHRSNSKLSKYDISLEDAAGQVLAVFNGFFNKTFDALPVARQGKGAMARSAVSTPSPVSTVNKSRKSGESSLHQRLIREIHQRIAAFLKSDLDAVPIDEGLESLGLDSIGVNEITEQMSSAFGFELPATLMFEYPKISEMSAYLLEEFSGQVEAWLGSQPGETSEAFAAVGSTAVDWQEPVDTDAPEQPGVHREAERDIETSSGEIAVVGIGGVYPGSADVHEFWRKLKAGHDFIGEMPAPRRDVVYGLFPESMAQLGTLQGGFVANADYFDAGFFGLTDEEALAMDPQQRLFLVACWQALEDAGYLPQTFAGRNVGVYVGAIANEYLQTVAMAGFSSVHLGTGSALSGIANRSSYFFDLNGPSQSIDAACCSSLYALDRAVKDLRSGACEAALVGGVSYIGTPDGFTAYAGMNYLAHDWRCKAFADGGDGWSKGELFAAVFLKPMHQAIADGDPVYAVIAGSGTNHGGRSHFYEQPNSNKHAELIASVYREGGVDVGNLVHIEAHGTGTEMGDALEFNVFQRALKGVARERGVELGSHACALGSIKSNIGHTEAAAGIAGFIKSVLILHHRTIPPSLHVQVPNKHLRLDKSPLYLADKLQPLRTAGDPQRLYASVHSFNFSGAAAHVLLAESQQEQSTATLNLHTYPLCLSAHSPNALHAYLYDLADYLEAEPAVSLDALVYTINRSRSGFAHRFGMLAGSTADLLAQLRRAASGFAQLREHGRLDAMRYRDRQSGAKKIAAYPPLSDATAEALLEQWLDEGGFSWPAVLAPFRVARLHLPTHPFVDRKLYHAGVARPQAAPQQLAGMPVSLREPPPRMPNASQTDAVQPVSSSDHSPERAKAFVRSAIAKLFAVPVSGVDLEHAINAYPFDSVALVSLCDDINRVFGLVTTPPDYFAFVTLGDIAAFVDEQLARKPAVTAAVAVVAAGATRVPPPQQPDTAVDPVQVRYSTESLEQPVAIIGMSGAFPGAPDVQSFWQVLAEGRDCIHEIPKSRWDWQVVGAGADAAEGQGEAKWGGFITGLAEFDPMFFGISPREAELMDPQQRLLLTHVWQAIEDAGYAASSLSGSNTAVLMGLGASGFERVLGEAGISMGGHAATGLSPCIGPNRISFVLDLHGPSEAIDTACSSSLVALHRAAHCLRNAESDLALAGGVNTLISADVHASVNRAGMLAQDGRCKTFSDQANGYVRGEGIGVLVLKRLKDAEQSGDHIYGIILGSAENHGGRASSLTAPNPGAQAQLLVSAYRSSGVDPCTVTYIEAHGTGTKLGDPIEINGLKSAFRTLQGDAEPPNGEPFCGLGSVKTNIGHLEYAAGVAGVVKVLLQFRHRQLVKSLHCEVMNPYIALAGSPFYVVQSARPWVALKDAAGAELPRRAGVSSFGFGGANAHLILEEYAPPASDHRADEPVAPRAVDASRIIVLSARSEEQLRQYAARLHLALDQGDYQESDLPRIAYTLQVGRSAMESRLAFTAPNLEDLKLALRAFADDSPSPIEIFRGKREDSKDTLEILKADGDFHQTVLNWLASGKLSKLLALWVRGLSFDWSTLHGATRSQTKGAVRVPRRISLPTYPFRQNVYWISTPPPVNLPLVAPAVVAPSPMPPSRSVEPGRVALASDLASNNERPKVSLQTLRARDPEGQQARQPSAPRVRLAPSAAPEPRATPETVAVANVSRAELIGILKSGLSAALYVDAAELATDKTFAEIGLDSVLAVEWTRRLNQQLRIELPVAKLYDHPTLGQLADFVHGMLGRRDVSVNTTPELTTVSPITERPQPDPGSKRHVSADPEPILRQTLAAALYVDATEISAHKPFVELGLDSVIAVEWMRSLNERFGTHLPVTKLYDYPNIAALAGYIAVELGNGVPAGAPDAGSEIQQSTRTADIDQGDARGLVISGVMSLEELRVLPWKPAHLRPGEVTIQVRASAVNFPDTLCVNGLYPTMPAYPFVPGFEVAGVITAVGSGVTDFSVGDEVIALTGDELGGHAQLVNVSSQNLVVKPRNVTFEEACSLPVVFGTVYCAFAQGQLRRNEHVLIQTATGGCGLLALQLARLLGCICYGTSSRPEKLDVLTRLRVPHVFNYRDDFQQDISRITGGRGVDVVLNMVAGEAMQRGINSLAPSGRYLELAVHALKVQRKLDMSHFVDNQAFLSMDFRRLSIANRGQSIAPVMQAMVSLIESGQIVPIVSRIYPFGQIKEALAHVGTGAHIGKVVISHQVDRMIDCESQCIERMLAQHRLAEIRPLAQEVLRITALPSDSIPELDAAEVSKRVAKAPGSVAPVAETGIAIIGMAGQFPRAADLASYWRNIAAGTDCIREVPETRWLTGEFYDADRKVPGKSYCKWMGVVEDADKFDPLFFNISPAEAKLMDPQQRLFLQACWHAVEDAGINPDSLSGASCGVFVGCAQGSYGQAGDSQDLDAQALMGGNTAILAARISYFLNLKGPSLAIDTACSSSLVAINEACNYLQMEKLDLALAGGVSVLTGPGLHIMTSKAGMLSPHGRCFTFDGKADGFVPGEGVGVLLLKNLSRALADGDPIHGILRGWGVNQDGKTNGITAPSPSSQIQLQKLVYEQYEISPETITLVEAHGTGTKLGDPIEVGALIESFRDSTDKENYCALGSVKSNIGHTMSAAGISGVIKVLLALKHRQLPPTAQFEHLNEHILLVGSPFYINTELRPWIVAERGVRRAAVSSFSFSGTNAHVVIDEAPAQVTSPKDEAPCLIVLSARTSEQLRQQAHQLTQYLAENHTASLTSISYTLLTGRKHLAHRLAVVADNLLELDRCLRDWLASGQSARVSSGCCRAVDSTGTQAPAAAAPPGGEPADHISRLKNLGARFCLGESLATEQLFRTTANGGRTIRRVALPGYPFARDSYWIGGPGSTEVATVSDSQTQERSVRDASAEAKQWVFVAEDLAAEPLSNSVDWKQALRRCAGKKLLIVSTEQADRDSLAGLLTRMSQAEGTPLSAGVEAVAYSDLSVDSWRSAPDTVIILGPSGRTSAGQFVDRDISNLFEVCRLFMRKAWEAPIQFYFAYENDESGLAIDCEALSGFLASATLENSRHRWALISYDPSFDVNKRNQVILREWLSSLLTEAPQRYSDVRYRGSLRWVAKLHTVDSVPGRGAIFRSRATYLLAGGLGPMGMLLCVELARRYQATLVILSRSPLNEERHEQISKLESLGATVHYYSVDITDEATLATTFKTIKRDIGDLHGVMLLANQVQDGIIANKVWQSFSSETATKTKGTLYIDQLTADEPLEFFLLFSSMAAYGLAGSSGYSYASAFQNSFASYRNALSKAGRRPGFCLSCCWGPWTIDYYLRQSNDENRSRKFEAQGTDLITIAAAFPIIQSSELIHRDSLGMVAVRDAGKFRALLMLGDPAKDAAEAEDTAAADGSSWFVKHLERWERLQAAGRPLSIATVEETIALEEIRKLRPELIRRLYRLLQAEELAGQRPSPAAADDSVAHAEVVGAIEETLLAVLELKSVTHDEPFQNYGLDSIVAMKLVTRLESRLGMSIEPKWLIDFPTIKTLAAQLSTRQTQNATT